MRRISHWALVAALSFAAVSSLKAQPRPQFRPAVLGSKPDSLVNIIDGQGLVNAGQTDGAVMFCARALPDGRLEAPRTFRASPGAEKLAAEVLKRLGETKVAPAIYDHQPATVYFYGTVVFNAQEKPYVRVFLNQDPAELKKESDFISPQPVFGGPSAFSGLQYPPSAGVLPVSGLVSIALKADAQGNVKDLRVLNEEPPLLGFGLATLAAFEGAKFIPAFRDGDPAECDTVFPAYYPVD
jgi:hypothetical protein